MDNTMNAGSLPGAMYDSPMKDRTAAWATPGSFNSPESQSNMLVPGALPHDVSSMHSPSTAAQATANALASVSQALAMAAQSWGGDNAGGAPPSPQMNNAMSPLRQAAGGGNPMGQTHGVLYPGRTQQQMMRTW